MILYMVETAWTEVPFEHEYDAVRAFWMVGQYHNLHIDREEVRQSLEKRGKYEKFPLSIKKIEL